MAVKTEPEFRIDLDRLYTFGEIAHLCGGSITERTVRRWVSDGRIEYTQLPQERRIRGRQYIEFMDQHAARVA